MIHYTSKNSHPCMDQILFIHEYSRVHSMNLTSHVIADETMPCSPTHKHNSHSRVLKESVVRTKHFIREQIEPLPGHTPIVGAFLSLELNVESRFQHLNIRHFHDEVIGVSKDVTATHWDGELIGNIVEIGECA